MSEVRIEWGVDLGFAVARVSTREDAERWVQSYRDNPDPEPDGDPAPVAVCRTVTTTPWFAQSPDAPSEHVQYLIDRTLAETAELSADAGAGDEGWIARHQFEHYDEDDSHLGPCILVTDLPALFAAHDQRIRAQALTTAAEQLTEISARAAELLEEWAEAGSC